MHIIILKDPEIQARIASRSLACLFVADQWPNSFHRGDSIVIVCLEEGIAYLVDSISVETPATMQSPLTEYQKGLLVRAGFSSSWELGRFLGQQFLAYKIGDYLTFIAWEARAIKRYFNATPISAEESG